MMMPILSRLQRSQPLTSGWVRDCVRGPQVKRLILTAVSAANYDSDALTWFVVYIILPFEISLLSIKEVHEVA